MDILLALTAVLNVISAILAWVAKIFWAKEYTIAKEEIIKSKQAQIELKEIQLQTLISSKDQTINYLREQNADLKELNPTKIREYSRSVQKGYEDIVNTLENRLALADVKISEKSERIKKLEKEGLEHKQEIDQLRNEIEAISKSAKTLGEKVEIFKKQSPEVYNIYIPKFEPGTIRELNTSSDDLTKYIGDTSNITVLNFAPLEQELHLPPALFGLADQTPKDDSK